MAKFFVGQRVRLVRALERHIPGSIPCKNVPIGADGRVTSVGPFKAKERAWDGVYFGCECDLTVTFDLYPVDRSVQFFFQVEPILPSGHAASTESFQELMDRLNTQRVEKAEEIGI